MEVAPTAAAKAIVVDEELGWHIEKSAIDSSPSEHRLVSVISYQFITPDKLETFARASPLTLTAECECIPSNIADLRWERNHLEVADDELDGLKKY